MTRHYRVVVPTTVKGDLREIVEYYLEVNKPYSKRIFNRILERIEDPYRIVYRVFADEVLLVAILDARRNVEEILIQKLRRH